MADLRSYLQILTESLEKKNMTLQAILDITNNQAMIAESEDFDLDTFENTIDQKDAMLEDLNQLDEGFQQVFDQVKDELKAHQAEYKSEIAKLQDLIRKSTDLGVDIQSCEERNRTKIANQLSAQQREIRQVKTSSKVASNYYRNMTGSQNADSYFMDQKK